MSENKALGKGSAFEVFRVFLGLGLTSFGGPVAHLGYFRDAFVVRRRWLADQVYADLVALCQFLPGPSSSQVGMAIGLQRAGYLGMLAAWSAFTLPSAILLIAFAYGTEALGVDGGSGWIQGLKAAAVAVVANAVVGMASSLAPDRERATIAVFGMCLAMLLPPAMGQLAAIAAGAVVGLVWLPGEVSKRMDHQEFSVPVSRRAAAIYLAVFGAFLVLLPLLATICDSAGARMVDSYYRSGALVFGGGHVVLPLLQAETVDSGLVGRQDFLAGYGAAQAVPGPLFSFAAYLGAMQNAEPNGLAGAVIALVAIFAPSALLLLGALPFWDTIRRSAIAQRALMGINAAVVGLLGAALYDPVFVEGIPNAGAMAIAVASFVALTAWRAPAWSVVIIAGLVGFLVQPSGF